MFVKYEWSRPDWVAKWDAASGALEGGTDAKWRRRNDSSRMLFILEGERDGTEGIIE